MIPAMINSITHSSPPPPNFQLVHVPVEDCLQVAFLLSICTAGHLIVFEDILQACKKKKNQIQREKERESAKTFLFHCEFLYLYLSIRKNP